MARSIAIDTRQAILKLNELHKSLSEPQRRAALTRALNRSVVSGRANSAQMTRKIYQVKSSAVKKTFTIKRASPSKPEAHLTSIGSSLPVSAFAPRKTKKGVTVKIKGQRKLLKGAFFATMKNGHKGIFGRAQYKGNKLVPRTKRTAKYPKHDLPITEVFSLTVPSAVFNKGVIQPLASFMQESLIKNYAHELQFRQNKAAGLI